MVVQLIAVVILLLLNRKRIDPSKADENLKIIGAETGQDSETKRMPKIAFIIPVVPVLMNMLFK